MTQVGRIVAARTASGAMASLRETAASCTADIRAAGALQSSRDQIKRWESLQANLPTDEITDALLGAETLIGRPAYEVARTSEEAAAREAAQEAAAFAAQFGFRSDPEENASAAKAGAAEVTALLAATMRGDVLLPQAHTPERSFTADLAYSAAFEKVATKAAAAGRKAELQLTTPQIEDLCPGGSGGEQGNK